MYTCTCINFLITVEPLYNGHVPLIAWGTMHVLAFIQS